MPFDHDDPYAEVECKVLQYSEKAVKIEDEGGDHVWVPRSCLHGGDDLKIESAVGETKKLRIRQWFAEKNGLV